MRNRRVLLVVVAIGVALCAVTFGGEYASQELRLQRAVHHWYAVLPAVSVMSRNGLAPHKFVYTQTYGPFENAQGCKAYVQRPENRALLCTQMADADANGETEDPRGVQPP